MAVRHYNNNYYHNYYPRSLSRIYDPYNPTSPTLTSLSFPPPLSCPRCRGPRPARMRTTLTALPPYLLLHLKRYTDTGRKVMDFIDFPAENAWDLAPWLETECPTPTPAPASTSAATAAVGASAGAVPGAESAEAEEDPPLASHPGGSQYELAATVHHHAIAGVGAGHYTACIRVRYTCTSFSLSCSLLAFPYVSSLFHNSPLINRPPSGGSSATTAPSCL